MPRRLRLDAELVRRGLARSRDHAAELIAQARVSVGTTVATKAATAVTTDAQLRVRQGSNQPEYVSRGGHKLAGALAEFLPQGLVVTGRDALDAGASTGGFTQVLLQAGARSVTAVDVGYGQLAWPLRQDARVTVLERTHVKDLAPRLLPDQPQIVVADLSFISLTKVIPTLVVLAVDDADFVLMVKPQFEVGRSDLGKGGVVRGGALRAGAVLTVAEAAWPSLGVQGVCASPLPGPAGNVEYFLWMRAGAPAADATEVARVVAEGPQ